MHDVETFEDPVPRDDIANRVRLSMAHVQVTRWIGKHVQDIFLGTLIIGITGTERGKLVPDGEPAFLDLGEVVLIFAPGIGVRLLRVHLNRVVRHEKFNHPRIWGLRLLLARAGKTTEVHLEPL